MLRDSKAIDEMLQRVRIVTKQTAHP